MSWVLMLMMIASLEDGERALDEFRLDEAIALLEAAKHEGGHHYSEWVRVHEKLGIAYAYKGREADAIAVFDRLLLIDPAHALRYDLSPKATLPFEQARAKGRATMAIDVSWPHDAAPSDVLPISVEVVSDPVHLLRHATVHYRRRGESEFHSVDVDLSAAPRMIIPAPVEAVEADVAYELYVVVRDEANNEVLTWADEARPRELVLRYQPPALYERWWVWAIAGAILAGGSAATYALTRGPSTTYDLEVTR